jgi:hypothetical protein
MIDSKLEFRTPDEVEAVFYEAFMRCDSDVMAALWADGDVICVHPGSGAIVGYEAVTRSWRHIFTGAATTNIEFSVTKRSETEELAVHVVAEEIGVGGPAPALVLATNVYQKFSSGWLMIQHHGSVVQTNREGRVMQ